MKRKRKIETLRIRSTFGGIDTDLEVSEENSPGRCNVAVLWLDAEALINLTPGEASKLALWLVDFVANSKTRR